MNGGGLASCGDRNMGTKQLAWIVAVLVLAIAAYLVLRPLGDGDSDPGQAPPHAIDQSQ
jgi:uncharacterized membrane protein YfcA